MTGYVVRGEFEQLDVFLSNAHDSQVGANRRREPGAPLGLHPERALVFLLRLDFDWT